MATNSVPSLIVVAVQVDPVPIDGREDLSETPRVGGEVVDLVSAI